jgi:hypothetical protein
LTSNDASCDVEMDSGTACFHASTHRHPSSGVDAVNHRTVCLYFYHALDPSHRPLADSRAPSAKTADGLRRRPPALCE